MSTCAPPDGSAVHPAHPDPVPPTSPASPNPLNPDRKLWRRAITLVAGAAALCSLGALWGDHSPPPAELPAGADRPSRSTDAAGPLEVEVVRPEAGGLPRQVVQTGSVEAFESAGLYARVSGYLETIHVEIGDEVQGGQVLAEINAPELVKDVERQAALIQQANSRVVQAEARLATAQAERRSAEGTVRQAEAELLRTVAERSFRGKELNRIRELVEQKAVETKLLDEKQHQWEAASAAEAYARASAAIAQAELHAIDSRIEQAVADLAAAKADVRVASAELARAEVMANYTRIVAPFDGVVTERNFDRGAFIRAAAEGSGEPLVKVARTDHMRVVVRIADPDVPYVHPGQQAVVKIDALGGETFTGTISRVSGHQDQRTRTMRAEIDLPNPENLLAGGMYGAVSIAVPAPAENLTLPEDCLIGPAHNGRGKVYVLSEGRLHLRTVGVGRRDGDRVEVLSGLSASDRVLADGPDDMAAQLNGLLAVARSDHPHLPPHPTEPALTLHTAR